MTSLFLPGGILVERVSGSCLAADCGERKLNEARVKPFHESKGEGRERTLRCGENRTDGRRAGGN